jgi:hypothetical protein
MRGSARAMAACTSCAAESRLRRKSNCSVTLLAPSELSELMLVMPSIADSSRSSGVATDDAMVSALAPGSAALT